MEAVRKALWFIEAHFASELTLQEVAACAEVSRFYLLRAFGAATGMSIMQYVRARRLSQAATQLAEGSQDILTVALNAGYNSHEAFTRAFRDLFAVTPESIRRQQSVAQLNLIEARTMSTEPVRKLDPPRIEMRDPLLIAGLSEHYKCEQGPARIPAQWQRFVSFIGRIPDQKGNDTFGVVYNADDEGNMDYLCGVEVRRLSELPQGLNSLRLPARHYAIFFHPDHVASIRASWNYIWNAWLPQSKLALAEAPVIEHYDERFNPHTGAGGVELWVPLKDASRSSER
jgi:AraC family transcriptional regulator